MSMINDKIPLNAAQVKELFDREAVLFGQGDGVPDIRVAALFGQGAVDHARSMDGHHPGEHANGYGIGDATLFYLTYRGFRAAASFYNAALLLKGDTAEPEPCPHEFCGDVTEQMKQWLKCFGVTDREDRSYYLDIHSDGSAQLCDATDGSAGIVFDLSNLRHCPGCGAEYPGGG